MSGSKLSHKDKSIFVMDSITDKKAIFLLISFELSESTI